MNQDRVTPLHILCVIALICSVAGCGSNTIATKIVQVRPVSENSSLAAGYSITRTLIGSLPDEGPDPCTDSTLAGKVYRCFGDKRSGSSGVYDPCWRYDEANSAPSVLCLLDPTSHEAIRLMLLYPPGRTEGTAPNPRQDGPWAVELTTGEKCFGISGSHGEFEGHVVDYVCENNPSLELTRDVDRTTPLWSVQSVHFDPDRGYTGGPEVQIRTAYFSLPDRY